MMKLCTGFVVGIGMLIFSIVTLFWMGMAIGGSLALISGLWIWFTRDKHRWDFTS